MQLATQDRIFDTIVDTNKLYVSMETYYTLRKYKHKPNTGYVYLFATGNRERQRINIDLEVNLNDWDKKNGRLIENSKQNQDKNLIIDNFTAKITNIKTVFRLSEKVLTPTILKRELESGLVRVDFIAFFRQALDEDKVNLGKKTYRRYNTIWNKLAEFSPRIIFSDIELSFFNKYRAWLSSSKDNTKTTINGNMIIIKKYLTKAHKYGIKLKFDLNDVEGGNTQGSRDYLTPGELKKMFELFDRPIKSDALRITLGYFLFDTMTGLRVGDLMELERKNLIENEISFLNSKSNKDQYLVLNMKAREILMKCPELFVKKYTEEYMNRLLKMAAVMCGIEKTVSFHVGRHTFATCFLRMGGQVQHLQKLLKHSSITTTMVYVHIMDNEANEQIFVLDKLFD